METLLMIIAVFLILIVLLQSGKAESTGSMMGGSSDLFSNRKERGGELFITRLTYFLGFAFIILSFIIS